MAVTSERRFHAHRQIESHPCLTRRVARTWAHVNRDRQIELTTVSFQKVLDRSHDEDRQIGAILNKAWLAQRFPSFAGYSELYPFHNPHESRITPPLAVSF